MGLFYFDKCLSGSCRPIHISCCSSNTPVRGNSLDMNVIYCNYSENLDLVNSTILALKKSNVCEGSLGVWNTYECLCIWCG